MGRTLQKNVSCEWHFGLSCRKYGGMLSNPTDRYNFSQMAKKLKTSDVSTDYDAALDEIEAFIEKDKKNRKYIYNWLAYWDQRRHHFSRSWKNPDAPSTNLSESFNSRYVHTNDVNQKLIDIAKSDAAYALSLDRYLTKYAEGAGTDRGKENVRVAKDYNEQRKRATTDAVDEDERAKRRKGWRKQGSERPERKRCGKSQKFVKSLQMAKKYKCSINVVERTRQSKIEPKIVLACNSVRYWPKYLPLD